MAQTLMAQFCFCFVFLILQISNQTKTNEQWHIWHMVAWQFSPDWLVSWNGDRIGPGHFREAKHLQRHKIQIMARPFSPPLYPSGDIYPSATMTFPMQEDTSLRRFRWQHTCQDSWWHISTRTCKHLRRARGKGDKDTSRPLRLALISPLQLIKPQLKAGYLSFEFIRFYVSLCGTKWNILSL